MFPYFLDTDGRKWDVCGIHFCVDWGGRQAQMECQWYDDEKYHMKTFVYYYLTNEFTQWNSTEICDSTADVDGLFITSLHNMFKLFDNGERAS